MTGGVHLVGGGDPTLRAEALDQLVEQLLGGADRALALEELVVPEARADDDAGDDPRRGVVAAACVAAASPPLLSERRIVVLREIGNLSRKDQLEPLLAYLADPSPTAELVLVEGGGTTPKALADALRAAGAAVHAPGSEKTVDVVAEHARAARLKLTAEARRAITARLGDDAGRVPALVDVLAATYGPGATLDAEEIEPYLGAAGSVPVFQLTNAIEAGDVAAALDVLRRLLTVPSRRDARPMHPLQVLGALHAHSRRLLRVDDPDIATEADAHAALGGKGSAYGAKKVWQEARALGFEGIRRNVDLLAQADRDVKGASGLPAELVVELLVARLAGLSRSRRGR